MTNRRPVELKLLQLHERFRAALPKRIDEIAAGTYGLHDIAADDALYVAKQNGRARIEAA